MFLIVFSLCFNSVSVCFLRFSLLFGCAVYRVCFFLLGACFVTVLLIFGSSLLYAFVFFLIVGSDPTAKAGSFFLLGACFLNVFLVFGLSLLCVLLPFFFRFLYVFWHFPYFLAVLYTECVFSC